MVMENARDTIKDVSGIVKGVARHAARDARDAARDTVDGIRRRASAELPSLPSLPTMSTTTAIAAGVVTGASLALLAAGLVARSRARRHSFEGQTVLITGASRGLGLVLARRFAAEGAHVAILARGGAALAEAAQELRAKGADIDAFEADISNPAEAERAVHRLISRWGRIDVLVNNAGQILSAPQQHVTVEDFERSMGVHFYGPLHLIRAAVPHMRRQGGGRIVNIASIGGKVAVPHLLPYCASKFALVGLSDGLRAELARDRIAVTTIIPGLMRTGSHVNARFRGHHQREFAWFALADALPLTSMDVERAASKIIEATREKRARLIISMQAKTLAWLDAMAPGLVATAMATANRVLPGAAGAKGNEEHAGSREPPALDAVAGHASRRSRGRTQQRAAPARAARGENGTAKARTDGCDMTAWRRRAAQCMAERAANARPVQSDQAVPGERSERTSKANATRPRNAREPAAAGSIPSSCATSVTSERKAPPRRGRRRLGLLESDARRTGGEEAELPPRKTRKAGGGA